MHRLLLVGRQGHDDEETMSKFLLMVAGSVAAVSMLSIPATAQRATTAQSWEGAVHEMQIRGPRSTMRGPMRDGRILVTPGYQRHAKRYHRPRYYGMAR